jgi:hypothetical protein
VPCEVAAASGAIHPGAELVEHVGLQQRTTVTLLEDARATHFETNEPLLLHRGQVGTIVMTYDGSAFEVEFADRDGRPYALMPIDAEKLMLLRDSPDFAAA